MSSSTKLNVDSSGVEVSPTLYRSIIGSLLYLTASKSDITFIAGVCARYQAAPKESHLTVVKQIVRYINGTLDYGLWYSKDSNAYLVDYSDANWAGSVDVRKSTLGGFFYFGNNLVSWMSKKQNLVSLSMTKAEYIAAGSCCTQLLWKKKLLHDYGIP
ncbi:secreted RxLR effector protein 161-like [Quercus robur]|uniref:secreted RxLR effector protein 161-like n=1 Tax=Quercus robur TaxID=38942 RepID=UPI002161BF3A|nr:secreted RxLR effector protein 161-like [Quercus robur]